MTWLKHVTRVLKVRGRAFCSASCYKRTFQGEICLEIVEHSSRNIAGRQSLAEPNITRSFAALRRRVRFLLASPVENHNLLRKPTYFLRSDSNPSSSTPSLIENCLRKATHST